MDELEFYDGAWTGQEIDAGIGMTGTLASSLGIVVDGNKSAVSATPGQYVIVKNSTIAGVSDGLYMAAIAIPSNTAIDATYLTAISGGGLNKILSNMALFMSNATTKAATEFPLGISVTYNGYNVIPAYGTLITFRQRADIAGADGRGRAAQIGIPRQGTTRGIYVRTLYDDEWTPWTFISGTQV